MNKCVFAKSLSPMKEKINFNMQMTNNGHRNNKFKTINVQKIQIPALTECRSRYWSSKFCASEPNCSRLEFCMHTVCGNSVHNLRHVKLIEKRNENAEKTAANSFFSFFGWRKINTKLIKHGSSDILRKSSNSRSSTDLWQCDAVAIFNLINHNFFR